jgi:hypothetical protein
MQALYILDFGVLDGTELDPLVGFCAVDVEPSDLNVRGNLEVYIQSQQHVLFCLLGYLTTFFNVQRLYSIK